MRSKHLAGGSRQNGPIAKPNADVVGIFANGPRAVWSSRYGNPKFTTENVHRYAHTEEAKQKRRETWAKKKARQEAGKKAWQTRLARLEEAGLPAPGTKKAAKSTKTTKKESKEKKSTALKKFECRQTNPNMRATWRNQNPPGEISGDPLAMGSGFSSIPSTLPALLSGALGWMLPGLAVVVIGKNNREKLYNNFKGTNFEKASKAQAVTSGFSWLLLYSLTGMDWARDESTSLGRIVQEYRVPVLLGSGIRALHDILDAYISRNTKDELESNIRRVMALTPPGGQLAYGSPFFEMPKQDAALPPAGKGVSEYQNWLPEVVSDYQNWLPESQNVGSVYQDITPVPAVGEPQGSVGMANFKNPYGGNYSFR